MSSEEAVVVGDVRVLLVGDSDRTAAVRETLEAAFPGRAVLTARTPSAALERLTERTVDCVVCDVPPERPSPIEILRGWGMDAPIVAIVEDEAAGTALAAGATDVLAPGASPSAAAARIENVASRTDTGRYRRLLETSEALVVLLDDGGTLQYVTPSIEAETGFTPADLERRSLSRFVHPDDREAAASALADVTEASVGSTHRGRYRLRHADGTWTVYEVTLRNRLEDPTVAGVVVTVSPVRAGTTVDDRLVDAVDRLEGAFLALGSQWEITHVNEAAERLFSPTVDDPTGTVLWSLLPESVTGTFYERLHEAAATESAVTFELEYPTLETWLVVEVHPSASGVTLYAREPTGEAALEDRRERLALFESVVDALEDGVLVLEGSTVTVANAAVFDLLSADAIVGRDLEALVDADLADSIRERAGSSVVRRAEPIRTTVGPDAASVAVSVVPIPSDDRVVCVFHDETDRHAERGALASLRETGTRLLEAETTLEATQAIVDAAVDTLGADLVGGYRHVDEGLEPAGFATASEVAPPPLPPLGVEETALGEVIETGRAMVRDGADLERFLATIGVRADRVVIAPLGEYGAVFATVTDPKWDDEHAIAFLDSLTAMGAVALDSLERESAVRERERDLERQGARFERLSELGERKRAIGRRLVRAENRETLEESVCEELASVDWLTLAWIGEVDLATETVTPRSLAGDGTYLESVTVELDAEAGEPAGRTGATREPTVVESVVHEDESAWRRAALEREIDSVLSVPLSYDEYVYGTLTVYGDRPSTFDEETQAVFAEIGETVAYGINAVETRRALLVDGVTELELLTHAPDDPLAALARHVGGPVEVGSVVPQSSDRSTVFVTVPEAPSGDVRDAAESLESVESTRRVSADEERSPVELVVAEPTIASTLVDHGGVLQSVSAAGDRTRLLVELPRGGDVRSFVRRVGERYPRTELVARRERDRPVRTRQGFRAELREQLTDRQRRALEAAYYGGFFEWPRERTGEEVARSLGISQPTFNRHYRAAERKLFTLLFDERTADDESP